MKQDSGHLYEIKLFTGFISAVILVVILKELSNIFIPFFMSLLLFFLFNGVVKKMQRIKIPRSLALVGVLVFIFLLFYVVGVLLYAGASSFIERFPFYSQKAVEMLRNLFAQLEIPFSDVDKYIQKFNWAKAMNTGAITGFLSGTFGSFASFIGNLVLVLIFLMFMLAGGSSPVDRLYKAFDQERAHKMANIFFAIEEQVQQYLLIKSFISVTVGILCGIILFVGGIDFFLFSALLICLLNFIPNIGSVIATLFPVIIGLLQYGISLRVVVVTLCLMVTQFTVGNIVEPKITGKSLDLSPIIILMSLIFWGYIWGIVGMILAVPLTSALKICCRNIPTLRPIAELISAD